MFAPVLCVSPVMECRRVQGPVTVGMDPGFPETLIAGSAYRHMMDEWMLITEGKETLHEV